MAEYKQCYKHYKQCCNYVWSGMHLFPMPFFTEGLKPNFTFPVQLTLAVGPTKLQKLKAHLVYVGVKRLFPFQLSVIIKLFSAFNEVQLPETYNIDYKA